MAWKTRVALLILLPVLVWGPGCSQDVASSEADRAIPAAGDLQGRLQISGSSTMVPLLRAIAERFQKFHPGALVEVQPGGSGRGLADVREGTTDIGMVARTLQGNSEGLFSFPIARDGICLIIHRDNPIGTLSSRQVRDIYTARTTNWKAVGGRDAPITTISREEGRLALEFFAEHFGLEHQQIKARLIAGDNPEVFAAVAGQPNAIAFVSMGEAEHRASEGAPIKLLPVDGVAAASRTVRTGEFPLSRSLNLVTREFPTGLKMAFIGFALSPQVTDITKECDFVPYLD